MNEVFFDPRKRCIRNSIVIERVRIAGYEITVEPRQTGLGESLTTIAFFKGSAGELIELYQTR